MAATPPADIQARTLKAQTAFLKAFADRGIVLHACQAAKVGRTTFYEWRDGDAHFKKLYDEAVEDAADELENEIIRRGRDGVDEPVFQGGDEVGTIRRYSDRLLELAAKARRPLVFRERVEHTGANGGPIQTEDVLKNAKESLLEKLQRLSKRTGTPLPATVKKAAKAKRRS